MGDEGANALARAMKANETLVYIAAGVYSVQV